ncbi:MAG: DUF3305 domain-containing protein [Hyphomicrobiales bacterium]|nr:DUF3305 domain-containing protein [Hyphomicrobiales bacterium]MCP5002241.1 DUF3305 domain-containing protein [Hyphomicrobiales bacterium]
MIMRKPIDSPWSEYVWDPVDVMLDPPAGIHGKIREGNGEQTYFFLECDPLELHRKDAPAYRENLLQKGDGLLWIVLGEVGDDNETLPYYIQLVTASPFEAQDYLDSGELIVGTVKMPKSLRTFLENYVQLCPAEEEFIKRKQKNKYRDVHNFGQQPLHEIRQLKSKRQ